MEFLVHLVVPFLRQLLTLVQAVFLIMMFPNFTITLSHAPNKFSESVLLPQERERILSFLFTLSLAVKCGFELSVITEKCTFNNFFRF